MCAAGVVPPSVTSSGTYPSVGVEPESLPNHVVLVAAVIVCALISGVPDFAAQLRWSHECSIATESVMVPDPETWSATAWMASLFARPSASVHLPKYTPNPCPRRSGRIPS